MKQSKETKKMTNTLILFSIITTIFVVGLSVLNIYHVNDMQKITKDIYEHPLKVSNAALNVKLDIIRIHRDMKDIVLSSSENEILSLVNTIEKIELIVHENLKIIEQNILGDDGLKILNDTKELIVAWKPIRNKVITLVNNQEFSLAINITQTTGAQHVKKIESYALKLYQYANTKANEFIGKSNTLFEKFEMIAIFATLLFIFIFIVILLYIILKFKSYIEKIHSGEKYLQTIFEATPNIMIVSDGDQIYNSNAAMLKFFDYETLEDFRKENKCVSNFFITDKNYITADMGGFNWLEYILSKPDVPHNVCMFKDGKRHNFTVHAEHLDINDKNRNVVIFNDITKLEELNDRLEIAVTGTQDGLWDWNIITGDLYFSPQWKKQLGYEDDELENTYDTWTENVHPDDKEETIRMYTDNLEGRTSFYENIHRLRHKNGSWVWILARGKTNFDQNGKAIRMVGFHTDITKIKEAEEEIISTHVLLEQKKKELETIIQETPSPMMIHNEDGKVIMVNKTWEALTGYDYKDIDTIEKWTYLAYGERMPVIKEYIDNLYELKKKTDEGQYDVITKNGNIITWQVGSAPLGIVDGKRTVISSAMDITELKNKDEMLINQSRHAAMGEMIGMIAHQWRQPIAVISMNANNMLVDIAFEKLSNTEAKKYANSINKQTQHLSQTIDDFRNFFKPDKDIKEVNIRDTIASTLSIVKDGLKNNNIELTTSFETDKKVKAYPRELMQVFVNIINNSKDALISHKSENALITIRVYEDEKYINTEVCDNAGGIDEDILPKVFDPYFSTKNEKNGTGLGLYMSKMIIENHLNGTIEVYNNDKGACFTVRLLKNK